jgi:uncharacterized Rmd1/YagE family protein
LGLRLQFNKFLTPCPVSCVPSCSSLLLNQPSVPPTRHYNLWHDLRVDYEIERRFDAINRKLGPMLENAKFLLDVRAEQKSSGAEWIIIALICLEVIMNGAGHLAAYFWQ